MSDISVMTRPPSGGRPPVARARVVQAPADNDSLMKVTLVGYSNVSPFEVPANQWVAVPGDLPAKGDSCVVLFDDMGDCWVAVWDAQPVAGGGGGITQEELDAALALKQDAASAATDAELSAHVATQPAHGGDLAGTARPPTAHTHDDRYYTETETNTLLAAKADASAVATDAELAAHEADTTGVHGIANTANLVLTSDARLSDARTPLAHTHAQADVTGLVAALAAKQDASTAATDAELTTHAGLKTGVHGIPAMAVNQGLIWDGANWVATDLATQAELNTGLATKADTARGMPVGGADGQVLTKQSAADYDAAWETVAAGGGAADDAYHSILWGGGSVGASLAAAKYLVPAGQVQNGAGVSALATINSAHFAFYIDGAEWTIAGLPAPKLRMRWTCHVGATPPGRTIRCGLISVATWLNTAIATVGAAFVASTDFVAPAANSHQTQVVADFTVPTTGWYVMVVEVLAGATAASSNTLLGVHLQMRRQ